ncbi:uncharacterized protein [Diadema antillarum]|uniref:uncharacterized protein n=1 Tax=Diadema antillarum TaxID=105358 RepID=UPI003A87448E
MEDVTSKPWEEKKAGDDESQVQVVSQKDIHDFWDHVSGEERISDVCTTFLSETRQVTDKLYANSASLSEKFAVANFLLQVGALQFRIQKNPDNADELQTIIILQKPEHTQAKEDGVGVKEEEKETEDGFVPYRARESEESEVGAPMVESLPMIDSPAMNDSPAMIDSHPVIDSPLVIDSPSHANLQPVEETAQYVCHLCKAAFTTPWDLDLHIMDRCGQPNKRGRPRKDHKEDSGMDEPSTDVPCSPRRSSRQQVQQKIGGRRKRGRPRKFSPVAPAEVPKVVGSRRKRGRPRKVIIPEKESEAKIPRKIDRPQKVNIDEEDEKAGKRDSRKSERKRRLYSPVLNVTRSKRKIVLPLKLRDSYSAVIRRGSESSGSEDSAALEIADTDVPTKSPDSKHPESDDPSKEGAVQNPGSNGPAGEEPDCPSTGDSHGSAPEEAVTGESETGTDKESQTQMQDASSGEEMTEIGKEDAEEDADDVKKKGRQKKKSSTVCEICDKNFTSASYTTKHMSTVHGENRHKFKCTACNKFYANRSGYRKHLLNHRNKANNTVFPCSICEVLLYDKTDLKAHEKTHTSILDRVKCDSCSRTFANETRMKRHRNNVHTKDIAYPCTLCEKVFYIKNRLKEHMVTHSGKREHKCDVCGMEFFLAHQLKTHQKVVHVDGKPFLCDLCGSGFKSKGILKQHHLTRHTDRKEYPCRECGKLFSRSSLRNQHERVHKGVNPHPCEHCGKSFRDKFKLRVHVNWHLGIRPYSCDVCKKTFLVKGNLTKHMRIHTGERPYICEVCGRGCIDSSQLKKHMAKHHKIIIDRQLTKGPARKDGELPSRPKRKQAQRAAPNTAESNPEPASDAQQGSAYTIASDALIEISQQLAHLSNNGGTTQIVVSNNLVSSADIQVQGSEVVATTVAPTPATTADSDNVFPVVLEVASSENEVTVPVTQSINDFQSLELISL